MCLRTLTLFVLTAALAVLGGQFGGDALAQDKKARFKNKRKLDVPPAVEKEPAPPAKRAPLTIEPVVPNFKPLPIPTTKDAAEIARLIDAEIAKKLTAAGITASARSTDEEFLRRAYLDITGVIPSADKAREFLDDKSADKRAKLLDELLADSNYGRRMADIWTAKLFPRDSANRFVMREPLYKWFEEKFNGNEPWDKLVTNLVTATGTVEDNPAVTYLLANRTIDKLTDTVGQHFLGIQLQCAQCHNHPFTTWKQTEYWGMAAFFSKVKADNPRNANKGGDNTKIGVTEGPGRRAKDFLPESAKTVPAKFLGGKEPSLDPREPFRPILATWMTAPENPYFARALVNRTWAHLFGRGIVHPVDDMIPELEPSHPELIDALARHIATTGEFDMKYLIKAICLSDAYQRTSKPTADNRSDTALFSHMRMKVMSPEQLFDSLARVTGNIGAGIEPKRAKLPMQRGAPVGARAQFVNFFLAGAESASAVDYEAGIPQALRLMNAPIANNPLLARRIVGSSAKPEEALEALYLATLSRRPTTEERSALQAYLSKATAPAQAYSDILWVLLNGSEFTMVR
jgi:uncharacterized protein DUF1549/uncharacterized protein DUF1553